MTRATVADLEQLMTLKGPAREAHLARFVWPAQWLGAIEGRASVSCATCETCDGTGYAWDESLATDGHERDDNFVPCPDCDGKRGDA